MGGKVWSREEESAFWSVIVPSSNKRLLMDRPSAQNPRGWTQLATMMQNIMGSNARRRYTPLMLYEHFFQNAVLESYSPSARSFVRAYINEELRVTGHKPSERSRNLVRSAPSEMLASRHRTIVNRPARADSMPKTTLPQLPNQPPEDSTDAAPSAIEIAPASSSDSFLSPELEAEVSNHLINSTLASQLPLPPRSDMYQPRYFVNTQFTNAYEQDITVYPQPYEHTRYPPMATDPAMQPEIYGHHPMLPSLSTVVGMSTIAAPSIVYPLGMMEWAFSQESSMSMTAGGVAPEAYSAEAASTVHANETTNAAVDPTFDRQFQLDQLPILGAPGHAMQLAQAQWADVPQLAAPPASPVSRVSPMSPISPISPVSSVSPTATGLSATKAPVAAAITSAPALPLTPVETHLEYEPADEQAPEQQASSSETQVKSRDDQSSDGQNPENEKGMSTTNGQDDGLFVPQWA